MVDEIDHYQKAQDCVDDFMTLMADEMKAWVPEHFLMLGQMHALMAQVQAFKEDTGYVTFEEAQKLERIAVVNFLDGMEKTGHWSTEEANAIRHAKQAIEQGKHAR